MTDHYSITPPPELALQWINDYLNEHPEGLNVEVLVVSAAQWGADQELEACCEWLCTGYADTAEHLRAARRPKPPSLKEQALVELEFLSDTASGLGCDGSAIRRALEALPND
jgi:hypothetical protein